MNEAEERRLGMYGGLAEAILPGLRGGLADSAPARGICYLVNSMLKTEEFLTSRVPLVAGVARAQIASRAVEAAIDPDRIKDKLMFGLRSDKAWLLAHLMVTAARDKMGFVRKQETVGRIEERIQSERICEAAKKLLRQFVNEMAASGVDYGE